jgi:hypothetical protein
MLRTGLFLMDCIPERMTCQAAKLLTGSIREFGNLTLTGLSTLSGQRVTDLTAFARTCQCRGFDKTTLLAASQPDRIKSGA